MRALALVLAASIVPVSGAAAQDLANPTYEAAGLQWTRAPSLRHLARQFQVATSARPGDRGMAEVVCTPTDEGRLNCDVVNETPTGMGYGRAAVNVLERARVSAVDGGSPAGRTFGYRIRFGNWPSRLLPDSFHPVDAGLRWTRRPEMTAWNMRGQAAGERYSQTFDCVANADQSVTCAPVGPMADPDYVEASLLGLNNARVIRESGGSPEGVRFSWTVTVERQTNCGGNHSLGEVLGASGGDITRGDGPAGASSVFGAASTTTDGTISPNSTICTGAMVVVGN